MLSERERLILTAALNPQANVATRSWQEWAAKPLEDAPSPELRLLPVALANLSRVAPTLELPKKVHGLARMTFAKSRHLVFCSSEIISELIKFCPVLTTKGLAMLIRFDAWSSRQMADIDIHVPFSALSGALDILAKSGWEPRYGMTLESLRYRSSLRRESWNFTKGVGHIDLHWLSSAARTNADLESQMWKTAETIEFAGQKLLLQSPEYAFVTTLYHGFLQGHRSDTLQTIVDAAWLLPLCNDEVLSRLVHKADLLKQGEELMVCLRVVGAPATITTLAKGNEWLRRVSPSRRPLSTKTALPRRPLLYRTLMKCLRLVGTSARITILAKGNKWLRRALQPGTPPPTETALLRRPLLYRTWNILGCPSRIERFILKWMGPLSKPLNLQPPRSEYDLRDCAMIDEIAGPGWSWPEPDHSCFRTDRADVRLLVPLSSCDDHLITIYFHQRAGATAHIDIFANGVFVQHQEARLVSTACSLMVPRRLLFGPWVEISLRPKPYLNVVKFVSMVPSVPVRQLCVLNMRHASEDFSESEQPALYVRILNGEQPYASKFARIEEKIRNSPWKDSRELPVNFDELKYVLSYPDLFEHEVDPYEHFLVHGRHENRAYR
jgi:hypothetical protein